MSGGAAIIVLREIARYDIKNLQIRGIDKTIWDIYNLNLGDYPSYNTKLSDKIFLRKRELKSFSESPRKYISRLILIGKAIEKDDNLYLIKKNISLKFTIKKERTRKTIEEIERFFEVGNVQIRNNHFRLDYQGWNKIRDGSFIKGKKRDKPDNIIYHS